MTACFSVTLLGTARAGDARRDGRSATMVAWAALATVALIAFFAFAVEGILVVVNK